MPSERLFFPRPGRQVVQVGVATEVDQALPIKAIGGASTVPVSRDLSVKYGIQSRDDTVARTEWDMTCTSFGALLGGATLGQKGVFFGGVVAYFWARLRWHYND